PALPEPKKVESAPATPACLSVAYQPAEPPRIVRLGFVEGEPPGPAPGILSLVPAEEEPHSPFPRREQALRRSIVDSRAAPCFGHAPDYSWVSGQVEYSRIARQWRVRYASVDEADCHGGRVILIENGHVDYLVDGQYVRVQGHLVTPKDGSEGEAYYRIES